MSFVSSPNYTPRLAFSLKDTYDLDILTPIAHITDSKEWTTPAHRRHAIHTNNALVRAQTQLPV